LALRVNRQMTGPAFRLALSLLVAGALAGDALAGAPLKGVDVKLGRPPGGTPVASRVTDNGGKFDFGVLAKGNYQLTIGLPEGTGAGTPVSLVVEGVPTGNVTRVLKVGGANAKTAGPTPVMEFTADGVHPIAGRISTADAGTD
jgi:hypothetical protein